MSQEKLSSFSELSGKVETENENQENQDNGNMAEEYQNRENKTPKPLMTLYEKFGEEDSWLEKPRMRRHSLVVDTPCCLLSIIWFDETQSFRVFSNYRNPNRRQRKDDFRDTQELVDFVKSTYMAGQYPQDEYRKIEFTSEELSEVRGKIIRRRGFLTNNRRSRA